MRSRILFNFIFLWGLAVSLHAQQTLIQTITVLATEYQNIASNALVNGGHYYLKVTGRYGYGGWSGTNGVDGAYRIDNQTELRVWTWNGSNTQRPTPNSYNSDHEYYFYFTGDGTTEVFGFVDNGGYGDNGGSLTIKIYRLDPATPTGLVATPGNAQNVLTWTANSESDLASYKVYGGTSSSPTSLLATVTSGQTYTHSSLTNGTLYYYRISAVDDDDNEGSKTSDVSSLPHATDGDYSFSFDGSNDYVEVPYASAINPTSYTVSAWAKVEGGSGFRSVITSRSDDTSGDKGYMIYAGENDTWQFWTGTGTGTNSGNWIWHQINSAESVGSDWAFLTATYNGTTMKFYVNGVQKGGNLDASAHKNTTEPMRIGAGKTEDTVPEYYFNGKIDEVAIWNEALGSAEITALYNSGDGLDAASDSGNYTSEGNLVAYYKMNDGSGNTLTDNEDDGTDYDGTLNNMVTSGGNSVWTDR